MKPVRVLLVDDHALIRRGLCQLLGEDPDVDVVGEAADAAGAMDAIRRLQPQVVVLDIALGGRDGLDVLQQVRSEERQTPGTRRTGIIMLSVYGETSFALRAIRSGADAYLNKGCAPAELQQAIKRVAGGHLYLTPGVAELLAHDVRQPGSGAPHERLSHRELQVLQRLAAGDSATTIAASLCLSVNTISTYRTRVLDKLQLHSTADLVTYALRHGLLAV